MDINALDTLGRSLVNAAMQSLAAMVRKTGHKPTDEQYDLLTEVLKEETKARIGELLRDGQTLVESGNSGWIGRLVQTVGYSAAEATFERVNFSH